mmetsp:Transcript_31585/g.72598  ORF Transcript_31585/g.72598 Transcript_31585/m.72598 type:complete len:291 (+) Transcript_31585:160-1032(+)
MALPGVVLIHVAAATSVLSHGLNVGWVKVVLLSVRGDGQCWGGAERAEEHGVLVGGEGGWELDVELDVQVAFDEGVALHRHALLLHEHDLVGLDNLARGRLDQKLAIVQVVDNKNCAGQGLRQRDRLGHQEIVTLTLEHLVFLLLNHKDDVTRHQPGFLVCFASEINFLAVLHALLNVHLEDALLLGHLVAPASLATVLVLNDTSFAFAVGAASLHLLHHPWCNLTDNNLHTAPLAPLAGCRSAFDLASAAFTGVAQHLALDGQFDCAAVVEVLESDVQRVHHVFTLAGT